MLYLPLILVAIYSFNSAARGMSWESFSLQWYESFLKNEDLRQILVRSLLIATATGLLSGIVGTIVGYTVAVAKGAQAKLALWLLIIPAVLPDIVLALTYALAFTRFEVTKGFLTTVLAQSSFGVSYVGLFVVVRARSIPLAEYRLVAQSLGATTAQIARWVTTPLILPASIIGALIVFGMSLQDFVYTFFCGSASTNTLSLKIYGMVKFGVSSSANVAYVLLALGAFWAYFIAEKITVKMKPKS